MRNQNQQKEQRNQELFTKQKMIFLFFCFVVMLMVCMGRVVFFKVVHGEEYEARAKNLQINRYDYVTTPNRGSILDRNEQVLAMSTAIYHIALDPILLADYGKNETGIAEQEKTISTLVEYFPDLDADTLWHYITLNEETGEINLPVRWRYLVKNVERSVKEELEELGLKGLNYEQIAKRVYPLGSTACHLIGFVRGDTSWGLENIYDSYMEGISGRSFIVYESSQNVSHKNYPAQDGDTIITTIDYGIQQLAEEVVRDTYNMWPSVSVMAIVMNPNTGEILAMADQNQFDLNNPSTPLLTQTDASFQARWEAMDNTEQVNYLNTMWKNFCIAGTYEPGSTFKPAVVAAALEENIITPETTFFCDGGVTLYDEFIGCHLSSGHGVINTEQVMAYSCNMGMVQIAQKMQTELFYQYQTSFGFGQKTGIDLLGEESGIRHTLSSMGPVELATYSIGQTFNATSIQSMVAFSAVINGGNILKPYVVSKILDSNGNLVMEHDGEVVRKVISEETSDYIREALKGTVEYGTGTTIAIDGYSLGCKTGTAEQGDRRRDDLWTFSHMTYFPVENPQYLVFTAIHLPDNYVKGLQSSAPMTKSLLEKILKYKNIQPTVDTSQPIILGNTPIVMVSDYMEKSTYETVVDLQNKGLTYKVIGAGNTITNQVPKGGTTVEVGSEIRLYVTKSEEDSGPQRVPNLFG